MKNVKNLSLLAIVAVIAALAFKPAPQAGTIYAVASETATEYVIAEALTGETEGVHFLCNNGSIACKIQSTSTPVNGKILKSAATALDANKTYVDLSPNDGD